MVEVVLSEVVAFRFLVLKVLLNEGTCKMQPTPTDSDNVRILQILVYSKQVWGAL